MKRFFLLTTLFFIAFSTLHAQLKVWSEEIDFTGNVYNSTVVGQVSASIPEDGMVLVRFDGTCISSIGDRIVLAASNTDSWGVNDGSTSIEANPNQSEHSFSHSRVYPVSAGTNNFYAIAHAYVETSGSGNVQIVGFLTVKFYPNGSPMTLSGTGISETGINLRGNPVALAQLTINSDISGKAIVHFDGECVSDPGDRIVLAASNTDNWGVNDGNTSVEAIDTDYNSNSFSHTRVYDIGPGNHTFYAIGQNYVEEDGSGIASIYGTLTVEFIPDMYNPEVQTAFTGIGGNFDFNANTEIASITINAAESGMVIATFDGNATPDGFLLLGVSDQSTLESFGVGASVYDSDIDNFLFSHTQVYAVNAGVHNFFATGAPSSSGGSTAWVYASLVGTFVANEVNVKTQEAEGLAASIEIFPNPTADRANVQLGEVQNIRDIQLLNAEGKVLQRFDPLLAVQDSQIELNLQALPSGTYYLQVITNDYLSLSKKITKQ